MGYGVSRDVRKYVFINLCIANSYCHPCVSIKCHCSGISQIDGVQVLEIGEYNFQINKLNYLPLARRLVRLSRLDIYHVIKEEDRNE